MPPPPPPQQQQLLLPPGSAFADGPLRLEDFKGTPAPSQGRLLSKGGVKASAATMAALQEALALCA